jgi:hypothetical protein
MPSNAEAYHLELIRISENSWIAAAETAISREGLKKTKTKLWLNS